MGRTCIILQSKARAKMAAGKEARETNVLLNLNREKEEAMGRREKMLAVQPTRIGARANND